MMCQVGHLPFYLSSSKCDVVRIAESRPSIVTALKNQYDLADVTVSDSHEELLNDTSIDAVVLSSPRAATGALTLACLNAGKHVLAEKPMAHTVQQASLLVDVAKNMSLIYAVGYMKRYDPGIQTARKLFVDLCSSGRLGAFSCGHFYNHSKSCAHTPPSHQRPMESRSHRFQTWPLFPDWIPYPFQESYAWYLNSASHDINLINYFFEAPLEIVSSNILVNGTACTIFKGADFLVSLDISKAETGSWAEGGELIFEQGRISFVIPSPMDVEGVTGVWLEENAVPPIKSNLKKDKGWSFMRQAEAFADALQGGTAPATTGADALRDIDCIEKIWQRALQQ